MEEYIKQQAVILWGHSGECYEYCEFAVRQCVERGEEGENLGLRLAKIDELVRRGEIE